jgi:hypothetical protein
MILILQFERGIVKSILSYIQPISVVSLREFSDVFFVNIYKSHLILNNIYRFDRYEFINLVDI